MVRADHYVMTVTFDDKPPAPTVRPFGFINQRPHSVNAESLNDLLPHETVYFRIPVDRQTAMA